MNEQTGELYLVREIDLEALASSVLTLQIKVSGHGDGRGAWTNLDIQCLQASQIDNPLRQAIAKVDVFISDVVSWSIGLF